MVRTPRAELETERGTIQRVAQQLGYGTESVRSWVRQADIDEGHVPGVSTRVTARMKPLEQEIRVFTRANEMAVRQGHPRARRILQRHFGDVVHWGHARRSEDM